MTTFMATSSPTAVGYNEGVAAPDVGVRVAGVDDAGAIASLRALWEPVGMASMFEYRRMPRPRRPDSRTGYVSNMFVREDVRNRGIGSALLGP
jgi:GNAT superfamily N-acetyltransferase